MWSASGRVSNVVDTYGPPTTTRFPLALHSRRTCFKESFCTNIAVAITISAHSISDDRSLRTFKSTRRRSQARGNRAETVKSPSGGNAHRLPSKGSAWRKLQYVSGNSGLINRTFIAAPLSDPINNYRAREI